MVKTLKVQRHNFIVFIADIDQTYLHILGFHRWVGY